MTRYTANGKQVLENGLHYADARSHKAAMSIAAALEVTPSPPILHSELHKDRTGRHGSEVA